MMCWNNACEYNFSGIECTLKKKALQINELGVCSRSGLTEILESLIQHGPKSGIQERFDMLIEEAREKRRGKDNY